MKQCLINLYPNIKVFFFFLTALFPVVVMVKTYRDNDGK